MGLLVGLPLMLFRLLFIVLRLAIPIRGSVESLNVSAAAAVMLFEAVRQRIGKSRSDA